MKVIICIDDDGGMMFNGRRQSRDRVLIEDVIRMTDGKELYIDEYSRLLFSDFEGRYTVDFDMLENACEDAYCFVENKHLSEYLDRIDEIIVYRWNRRYPSDFTLDVDLKTFCLVDACEFAGYSHDNITKERYVG